MEDIVERVMRKHGVSQYEVYYTDYRSIDVAYESDELRVPTEMRQRGVGVRVADAGVGFAYTNTGNLEEAVIKALKMAHASRDSVPLPEETGTSSPRIFSTDSVSGEDAIDMVMTMVETARSVDDRVRVDGASFTAEMGVRGVVTPHGSIEERFSRFSSSIMVLAVEGEEVSSFNYSSTGSCDLTALNTEQMARNVAESVVKALMPRKTDAFVGRVILAPMAFLYMLYGFLSNVTGEAVLHGKSALAGKIGEEVAGCGLTIYDSGVEDWMYGSRGFDREGVPTRRTAIVEDGTLKSFLHSTYTATRMKSTSTGNAAGGFRDYPSVGFNNIIVEAGNSSLDEIVESTERGLYVTRFSGTVHPGGDYSGVVKCGFLIENGEIKHPLRETQITGNFFDGFRKISAVSRERENLGPYLLPHVAMEDVRVVS